MVSCFTGKRVPTYDTPRALLSVINKRKVNKLLPTDFREMPPPFESLAVP